MFSAHLLFADLNGHSTLPFKQRTEALNKFWSTCTKLRPSGLTGSRCSFYDVDNDNLMAGFSDVPKMRAGIEVLRWGVALYRALAEQDISISFAADLMALRSPLDWPTHPGFIEDTRRLFVEDELLTTGHNVPRSRIVGDALIVTARLLKLAKATNCAAVFSTFQGGHIPPVPIEELGSRLGGVEVFDITGKFQVLGEKASDLENRQVRAYGIRVLKP